MWMPESEHQPWASRTSGAVPPWCTSSTTEGGLVLAEVTGLAAHGAAEAHLAVGEHVR
jgi:hypothetical protein